MNDIKKKDSFALGEEMVAAAFLKGLKRLIKIKQLENKCSINEAADMTLEYITQKVQDIVKDERGT